MLWKPNVALGKIVIYYSSCLWRRDMYQKIDSHRQGLVDRLRDTLILTLINKKIQEKCCDKGILLLKKVY